MILNKQYLLEEYQLYKGRAKIALEKSEIEKGLNLARYCGFIAWSYPILYHFVDDDLEQILEELADKIINQDKSHKHRGQNSRKVVLYAGQLIDSGALTEQYLHFFIENNYKVLVIVPSIKNIVFAKNTLKLIERTPGVEIYIPEARKLSKKICDIYDKVNDYAPEHVFLHFLPNDVVGYCVFSKISHVKKYYIVHNDHTFWIGKGCSDYFLEFRKFGSLLARQRRQIPAEKLLFLPYYPINNNIEFKGFPFIKTNQVVGLSAANLYKYLMDPQLKYFHAIKELLKRNANFVFCLCGYGDGIEKIQEIFNDRDVKDRFFFLGRREDFYSLIGNSDILFESYPLKGGLTMLFAINQNKALIGIGNPNDVSGSIQDVFDLKGYKEPINFEDFLEEADLLIKHPEFRKEKVDKFSGHKYNKQDFDKGLASILASNVFTNIQADNEPLCLDDTSFLDSYFKIPHSGALFLKNKLYFLKSSANFKERIVNYSRFCLERSYPFKVKELSRLAFLAVFGR